MKKFAVISGFLGSGKTTAMIALTRYDTAHGRRTAMISNDLGEGVSLADNRLAQLCGADASQITDECICFCHAVLTERLNACYDAGCELVLSDIPGFGVGALEHVYHGLSAAYPGQYELGPFTVLVEPLSVELLRSGAGDDRRRILDGQLREADLIVLSKCDLVDETRAAEDLAWLAARYPEAKALPFSARREEGPEALPFSARREEGLEALSRALREGKASLRHPAIDYDDEALQEEMGNLSEYYLQYYAVVCCFDFDGNAYLCELAEGIRARIAAAGREIPHLKLLAWEPEGDFGKADVLGAERPAELSHRFAEPCTELAVILNASAVCPPEVLDRLITEAVEEVSARFQLACTLHKKDCFGMGD